MLFGLRFITIRLGAVPFNITIVQLYAPTSDYDDNKRRISTSYRVSLIRHWSRTFLLCKETGMQKWARMLEETGKAFVAPSAIKKQLKEDSDFWSLPPLTILCWQTLLVITKHPEDGPGIAQVDNTTARLIIFWWGSASDQEWTLPEHEVFQEQTLGVTTG